MILISKYIYEQKKYEIIYFDRLQLLRVHKHLHTIWILVDFLMATEALVRL